MQHFWDSFQSKIAYKGPYKVSIEAMRFRLPDMQNNNDRARKPRALELFKRWKYIEKVLRYGSLSYIPEIIRLELMSRHYDNPLAGYFGIAKTQELIARKYY